MSKLKHVQKPGWHGVVLVAGGAVGAGMFALPMVSAGAWSLWSLFGLVVVWWFTYLAAKILLDTNLALLPATQLPDGTRITPTPGPPISFDTLVKKVLGPKWAAINNLSIAFILLVLMYAYISAGASIIKVNLEQLGMADIGLNQGWLSVIFATAIALVVWLGTALVARISVVFMLLMAISFVAVVAVLIPHIRISAWAPIDASLAPFLLAALPVYVTAFACAGIVPSLVKHYQHYMPPVRKRKVQQSLFWGTLLALMIYVVWLAVTFGVIERSDFKPVLAAGGNTGDLVQALSALGGGDETSWSHTQQMLTWFSHCAVITSFLSVALGLSHFVQDKLDLKDGIFARAYAVLLCFIPPTLGSFFFPDGFLLAIAYAGLFVTFSFFVVPVFLAARRWRGGQPVTLSWLKSNLFLVLCFGLSVAILKVMNILGFLPKAF